MYIQGTDNFEGTVFCFELEGAMYTCHKRIGYKHFVNLKSNTLQGGGFGYQ